MIDAQDRLPDILAGLTPFAIAVSGGVDSMALASLARRTLPRDKIVMIHATSPAVPQEATRRVEAMARNDDWPLRVVDAGEFADPAYRANPANRCFFCKTHLYSAIASLTTSQVVSGANISDLGEYRPGLDAAREHRVRHPYVEAGFDKAMVRALARHLGLPAIADLPSAPCLSSRIETGIRIEPDILRFVHKAETIVGEALDATHAGRSVRCRVRATGIVIELDEATLDQVKPTTRDVLRAAILARAPVRLRDRMIAFEPYRTGSAFLIERAGGAT